MQTNKKIVTAKYRLFYTTMWASVGIN